MKKILISNVLLSILFVGAVRAESNNEVQQKIALIKSNHNNIQISDIISLGSLVIAVIAFISQAVSSRKKDESIKEANKNALEASFKANDISDKIYKIEKEYNELNHKKGVNILSLILWRYFTAFYSLYENKTPNNPTIKQDKISHLQFIEECKYIESDLIKLDENPNYINLVETHPSLIRLRMNVSFDIIALKNNKNNRTFYPNLATYFFFKDLYDLLKKEYSDSDIWKTGFFNEIEKSFMSIQIDRPSNFPQNLLDSNSPQGFK